MYQNSIENYNILKYSCYDYKDSWTLVRNNHNTIIIL